MTLNKSIDNIFDFTFDDFSLEGYDPEPLIKAPVAV
jgi:thymidylate synthase